MDAAVRICVHIFALNAAHAFLSVSKVFIKQACICAALNTVHEVNISLLSHTVKYIQALNGH